MAGGGGWRAAPALSGSRSTLAPRLQVHVNELLGGAETSAYLVKYDSVHGTRSMSISREPGCLRAAITQLESRV